MPEKKRGNVQARTDHRGGKRYPSKNRLLPSASISPTTGEMRDGSEGGNRILGRAGWGRRYCPKAVTKGPLDPKGDGSREATLEKDEKQLRVPIGVREWTGERGAVTFLCGGEPRVGKSGGWEGGRHKEKAMHAGSVNGRAG